MAGKENNSTKTAPSSSSDKVYTQEDLAKVLSKAKLYKTLYEEADKQVNLLNERLKECTDNNLMLANDILDRIITLENEHSTFREEQGTLRAELQSVTEQLTEERTKWKNIAEKAKHQEEGNGSGTAKRLPAHHDVTDDKGDSSFVIGGLQGLRKFYQAPRVDPAQLVRNVLYDV